MWDTGLITLGRPVGLTLIFVNRLGRHIRSLLKPAAVRMARQVGEDRDG